MRNILLSIIIFIFNQSCLFSQSKPVENLKKYDFYIETRSYEGNWIRKYFLKNGVVQQYQDIHNEQGLTNEYIYTYNDKNDIFQEQYIGNIGFENQFRMEIEHELKYEGKILIQEKDNFGWIKNYSDFNKLNRPKIIKTYGEDKDFYSIKKLTYDEFGNISVSIEEKIYEDKSKINEIEIISYKYDKFNNIKELHREYKPEKEFPIIMIGGINLYKNEYYEYKYNTENLWIKKSLCLNKDGKEIIYWTRKYK
jgi:hypothetical protein